MFLLILLLIISIFIAHKYCITTEFIVNEFLKALEFIKITIHVNLPFAIRYFDINFSFQRNICDGCHNLPQKTMKFKELAIILIKLNSYKIRV